MKGQGRDGAHLPRQWFLLAQLRSLLQSSAAALHSTCCPPPFPPLHPAPTRLQPLGSRPLCSVPAHDGGCYGLAFNRTGELLASGGADKCVKLWDPLTAALKTTLRVRAR